MKHRLLCPECSYQAWSACTVDIGADIIEAPYVCRSCDELADVAIGSRGKIKDKEQTVNGTTVFYTCTECGSRNIESWDLKNRPCPKCSSPLIKLNGPGNVVESM